MALSSVVKRWSACKGNTHRPFNATDSAVKMVIPARIGRKSHRHEVFQFRNSIPKQESCHQDVRGWQIQLLVSDIFTNSLNLEPPALVVVENCSEDTWRVEVRVTIPVDRSVHCNQCDCPHVADDSVVLDGLI